MRGFGFHVSCAGAHFRARLGRELLFPTIKCLEWMLLLFFMGVALLKLSVDGPLTTSNGNQLVLVVATEGICHRIKEHVMDSRRGNAASSTRHLCHSLSLLLTMVCLFFPVCS